MTIAETCKQSLLDGVDLMLSEIDNFLKTSVTNPDERGVKAITAAEKSTLSTILGHLDDMGAAILGADRYAKLVAVKAVLDA